MTDFEPIIKKSKSTLQNKKVSIQGSNSFGQLESDSVRPKSDKRDVISEKKKNLNKSIGTIDLRLKASKTQKVSPSTNLKVNTLKPFLKETESMNTATFNEIIDMLVDNYIQTKLTTRQNEAYRAIYKSQYEML